jgi:sulfonate transport system substrate-binding protein
MGVIVAPDSDITTVEQLKGAKIACSIGSAGHKYIINILSSAGLTVDDVELVNLSDETSQIAALAKGEIDAAVMVSNLATAEEQGIGTVLETPDVPTYIFIETTGDFIREHEDVVQVYVDSVKWGEKWYEENQEEYYELAGEYWDLEPDEVKTYFAGDSIFDANMPTDTASYLKNTADFLLAQDLITDELSEDEIAEHLYDLWQ